MLNSKFLSVPCMPCVPQTPGKSVAFGSIWGTCFAAHVPEEDGLHEWSSLAISGRFHMRSVWAVACGSVAVAWKPHKWHDAIFALVSRALLLKQKNSCSLRCLLFQGFFEILPEFPLQWNFHCQQNPIGPSTLIPSWATFFVKVNTLWQCGKITNILYIYILIIWYIIWNMYIL